MEKNNARGLIDVQFRNYASFSIYQINFDRVKDYNDNYTLSNKPAAILGLCFVWPKGLDAGVENAIKNYWNKVIPNAGHLKSIDGELSVAFVVPMTPGKVPIAIKQFQKLTDELSDNYGAPYPVLFYCLAGELHTTVLPEPEED